MNNNLILVVFSYRCASEVFFGAAALAATLLSVISPLVSFSIFCIFLFPLSLYEKLTLKE